MGLASIAAASASAVRTQSEMDLYKVENKKRINVESTLSQARGRELDAKAQEADGNNSKVVSAYFDKKIADNAATIAALGVVSTVLSTAGSILSAATDPSVSYDKILSAAIQGAFSIAGAILALIGASAEAKMLGGKFGDLSEEAKEDKKMMEALGVAFG
jgi:hypothetical protein